jgi:hypothetical protein
VDQEQDDDSAAAIATEQLIRTAISIGTQLAIILAVNWAYLHADDVKDRGRALLAVARRRKSRLPPDAGLQAREFGVMVSAYDHGDRAS